MPGALLIGDTAGLLNVPKIKGTHQAMRSRDARRRASCALARQRRFFRARLRDSEAMAELKEVRNIKPGFKRGLWFGIVMPRGRPPPGPLTVDAEEQADWSALDKLGAFEAPKRDYVPRDLAPRDRPRRRLLRRHRARRDRRCTWSCTHLALRHPLPEEYNNPCTRFCPAGSTISSTTPKASACDQRRQRVHCKTSTSRILRDHHLGDTEGGAGPNIKPLTDPTSSRSSWRRKKLRSGVRVHAALVRV